MRRSNDASRPTQLAVQTLQSQDHGEWRGLRAWSRIGTFARPPGPGRVLEVDFRRDLQGPAAGQGAGVDTAIVDDEQLPGAVRVLAVEGTEQAVPRRGRGRGGERVEDGTKVVWLEGAADEGSRRRCGGLIVQDQGDVGCRAPARIAQDEGGATRQV